MNQDVLPDSCAARPFEIESEGTAVGLRLRGDITIEQAGELRMALQALLRPGSELRVDAAEATKLDAAALQVLVAAARSVRSAALSAASLSWDEAFRRFALDDPFAPSSPHSPPDAPCQKP
jgi:anti-anti-sigma regulatory factor